MLRRARGRTWRCWGGFTCDHELLEGLKLIQVRGRGGRRYGTLVGKPRVILRQLFAMLRWRRRLSVLQLFPRVARLLVLLM